MAEFSRNVYLLTDQCKNLLSSDSESVLVCSRSPCPTVGCWHSRSACGLVRSAAHCARGCVSRHSSCVAQSPLSPCAPEPPSLRRWISLRISPIPGKWQPTREPLFPICRSESSKQAAAAAAAGARRRGQLTSAAQNRSECVNAAQSIHSKCLFVMSRRSVRAHLTHQLDLVSYIISCCGAEAAAAAASIDAGGASPAPERRAPQPGRQLPLNSRAISMVVFRDSCHL